MNQLDPITGLHSRASGIIEAENVFQTLGSKKAHALAFELYRFGQINDSIGDKLGDKVLKLLSKRLAKIFPESLLFYRIHGDQFIILFDGEQQISEKVVKLFDFVQRPFAVQGHVIVLNIRIGIAPSNETFRSSDELIKAAELSLHRTKTSGEKAVVFKPSMIQEAKLNHQMANDLRVALVNCSSQLKSFEDNDEFIIQYQPVVNSVNNEVLAFEATLKWKHPMKGLLDTSEYLETAKEIGALQSLGSWLIGKACRDAANWNKQRDTKVSVSVDLYATQVKQGVLFNKLLEKALNKSSLSPELLQLEIQDLYNLSIDELSPLMLASEKGCKLILDNFGNSQSSINQLLTLKFDYLKCDYSLVEKIDSSVDLEKETATKILESLRGLANTIKYELVCKDVCRQSQVSSLANAGIHNTQGAIWSEVLDASRVTSFLAHHQQ